jgi:hypothetical protein
MISTEDQENLNSNIGNVRASTFSKPGGQSNLLMLTKSVKCREDTRKVMEGAIKPENDPFWNARCADKDERMASNPASVAIRAQATSKLLQPTAAYLHGARKKAEEELKEREKEAREKASQGPRVKIIEPDCQVSHQLIHRGFYSWLRCAFFLHRNVTKDCRCCSAKLVSVSSLLT